ncbi:EPS biosynthesis protein [Salinisphaera sp. PC39]|uniref:outer membrane beta-barrel protein n=1 Tax=Salinisphaera sp. PC39 TaxID=1304156 RepID=UPI0033415362
MPARGRRPPFPLHPVLAALILAAAPTAAAAGIGFAPYLELGARYDSNLLRVADAARGETMREASVGGAFEWLRGRQAFELSGRLSDVDYHRLRRFDHTAHELSARLDYGIGEAVSGIAGYDRSRELDDFGDRDADLRDLVTTQQPFLQTDIAITPAWIVRARLGELRVEHSEAERQRFDRRHDDWEIQLRHRAGSTFEAGLGLSRDDIEFPGRDADDPLGRAATQETRFVDGVWEYSAISRLRARVGHTRREIDGLSGRDFSAPTWRLAYERTVSVKTRLTLDVFRRIYSSGSVDASFIEATGAQLRLDWRYSPKIALDARLYHEEENYEGGVTTASGNREDRIRGAELEARYALTRTLHWIATLAAEEQSSNRPASEYDYWRGGLALRLTLDDD